MAGAALDCHRTALCLHIGADEVETEAEPSRGAALIATVEAIENARQIMLRNTGAGILDFDQNSRTFVVSADSHFAAVRQYLNGIRHQVTHDIHDLARDHVNVGQVFGEVPFNSDVIR